MKRWLALLSVMCGLAGYVSQEAVAEAQQAEERRTIQIGSAVLYVREPTLLAPSRDFPPLTIRQVEKLDSQTSALLFEGHWDALATFPRTVIGTLGIWVAVRPWPMPSKAYERCEDKARAVANISFESRMDDHRHGFSPSPPTMEFQRSTVAGQPGYAFRFPADAPPMETYIIPAGNDHYIYLILTDINNAPSRGDWPALSQRVKAEFLGSLELVGNSPGCISE